MENKKSHKGLNEKEFLTRFQNTLWTFEDEEMLEKLKTDLHSIYTICEDPSSEAKTFKWLNSLRERLGTISNSNT